MGKQFEGGLVTDSEHQSLIHSHVVVVKDLRKSWECDDRNPDIHPTRGLATQFQTKNKMSA